jgi:hypothetical protein
MLKNIFIGFNYITYVNVLEQGHPVWISSSNSVIYTLYVEWVSPPSETLNILSSMKGNKPTSTELY